MQTHLKSGILPPRLFKIERQVASYESQREPLIAFDIRRAGTIASIEEIQVNWPDVRVTDRRAHIV